VSRVGWRGQGLLNHCSGDSVVFFQTPKPPANFPFLARNFLRSGRPASPLDMSDEVPSPDLDALLKSLSKLSCLSAEGTSLSQTFPREHLLLRRQTGIPPPPRSEAVQPLSFSSERESVTRFLSQRSFLQALPTTDGDPFEELDKFSPPPRFFMCLFFGFGAPLNDHGIA